MKDANSSTRLKPGKKQPSEAPAARPSGDEHRAPPGSAQQHANQRELGVGEDHRTETMQHKHRGTYP